MKAAQVALYARVSSTQQAEAGTIESQLEALRARARAEGVGGAGAVEHRDNGYSGSTLARPGLERLRDDIAAGVVDRVYVHSPDRLARKYAYQVLLVDEFRQVGVEVVFLNHELGTTPEEDLLLQVQGMVAEYERAKILERSRRGKRHRARARRGAKRAYRYYRCLGTNPHRFGGERVCRSPSIRADLLEAAVWKEVRELLEDPSRQGAKKRTKPQKTP